MNSRLFATFFGAGYAPVASGTVGSLAALPLAWLAAGSWPLGLGLAAVVAAAGIPAAGKASRECGDTDPSIVVIDEVIGMILAVAGLGRNWRRILFAFLVFRAFDIVKPSPCRELEKLPGGFGIVADDVAAGIYTRCVMQVLFRGGNG